MARKKGEGCKFALVLEYSEISRGGEISLDSNRGFPSRWMSKFGSSRCDRATPWILKMWGKGKRRDKVVTSLRENGSGKGKRKKKERI